MIKGECHLMFGIMVSEPIHPTEVPWDVPAENTFSAHHHVIQIWKNNFKEKLGIGFDVFMLFGFASAT